MTPLPGVHRTPAVLLPGADLPAVLEDVLVLPPGPGEVRVRTEAAGLCHTDLTARRDQSAFPILLGHEGAGVVEAVGEGVTHLRPGDHVIVCWKVPCGVCRRCADGRPEHCEQLLETAGPRVLRASDERPVAPFLRAGTFCRYAVLPARGAVKVDRDLPFAQGAVIGCAVATGVGAVLRAARLPAGASVAVFGVGGIGLSVVMGARLALAGAIIAVDLDAGKLRVARDLGATALVNAAEADPVAVIHDLTGGLGVDFAFEAVGSEQTIAQALAVLGLAGEALLLGAAARSARLPLDARRLLGRQQTLRGCIYGSLHPAQDLPRFAAWQRAGWLPVERLISRQVELGDLPQLINTGVGRDLRVVAVLS